VILALGAKFGRLLVVSVLAGVFVRFGAGSANANWDARFGVPGADGPVWSIALHGRELYAAGSFTQIGGVFATNIAKWDGTNWSPLGAGLRGGLLPEIHALVFNGGDLYAGGFFTQAGSINSRGVAKWDGSNWSGLVGGVNGGVRALALTQGKLIAGGSFSMAGGVNMANIAAWDGTNWAPLGGGIPGNAVDSLTATGKTIYAGGRFRLGSGINATNIAMWNGTSWLALGEGIRDWDVSGGGGGMVRVLTLFGSDLIAAGNFRLAGAGPAANIARWNGIAWSTLGSGIDVPADLWALGVNGQTLYAAGFFYSAGATQTLGIAKWDGAAWSPLGSGIMSGIDPGAGQTLAVTGSELFLGGFFDHAGGKPANNIALWHIPHSLSIERTGNNVTLSWPATGTNFLLEATSDLGAPNWQGVSGTPAIANDQCVVTLAPGPGNQFFRLRRP